MAHLATTPNRARAALACYTGTEHRGTEGVPGHREVHLELVTRIRLLALTAITMTGCAAHGATQTASPSPASAPPDGTATAAQVSQPMPIAQASPLVPAGRPQAPRSSALLPRVVSNSTPIGNNGSVAYFIAGGHVIAVDLATGRLLWQSAAKYDRTMWGSRTAVTRGIIFVQSGRDTGAWSDRIPIMIGLSTADGNVKIVAPKSTVGSFVGGTLYAMRNWQLVAADPQTAKPIWSTAGATAIIGPAYVFGATLLQGFNDSSGKSVDIMYAYDVRSGRNLWGIIAEPDPLGDSPGAVYLNTTGFRPSDYFLNISKVDLKSGAVVTKYTYAPDQQLRPDEFGSGLIREPPARVAGGYVYLRVSGTWYRYVADATPANPLRLEGREIQAWLKDGRLLLTTNQEVAVGQMFADRLETQRLGTALRSPVYTRNDGTTYAVIDNALVALGGSQPRNVGRVACSNVGSIVFWPSHVAAICDQPAPMKALVFVDSPTLAQTPEVRPQVQPTAKPNRFRFHVHAYLIQPPAGISPDWVAGALAPLPDGGAAFVLESRAINQRSAIGRVTKNGAFSQPVLLPGGLFPVDPFDVMADSNGTIFFNDGNHPSVMALAPSGEMMPLLTVPPTPEPINTPPGGIPVDALEHAVPIALDPAGGLWFARNEPSVQIGRIDRSKLYDVPSSYGKVRSPFVSASDGAIWFVITRYYVGRMTDDGRFSRIALPKEIAQFAGDPQRVLAAGDAGSVWLAAGSHILKISPAGIVGEYVLPNGEVNAMTQGCDGALYANELFENVARVAADGTVEEYPTGLETLNAISTGSDCSLWFTAGWNTPRQYVGTFQFARR
jgi:outer membrane protein assembly factor BamB